MKAFLQEYILNILRRASGIGSKVLSVRTNVENLALSESFEDRQPHDIWSKLRFAAIDAVSWHPAEHACYECLVGLRCGIYKCALLMKGSSGFLVDT